MKLARAILNVLASAGLVMTGWSVAHSNLTIVSIIVVIATLASVIVRWIKELAEVPDGK